MLKKTMSFLLAICMVLSLLPANLVQAVDTGSSASQGLAYEAIYDEKGAVVSYAVSGIGSCTDIDLVIPATYNGLPVTVIGSNAFADCTHLTSVTLPDTITILEEYAFAWCHQLQSVNIPYGVTTIGRSAFVWCGSLAEIIIPTTATSIGDSAFHGCSKVTQIYIPANVDTIGSGVFAFCYDLAQITVDADNASYCDVDGILYTKDMTTLVCYPANKSGDTFTVPSGVTVLDYRAFMYSGLSEIILPQSLVTIGGSAFESCTNLQSITIPASVAEIASGCIEGCYDLTEILVEQGNANYCSVNGVLYTADLKTLLAYPIGSPNTSYTIPEGTENITQRVFFECMNLQEVIIPGTVSTIPNSAFEGCRALTNVVIHPGVTTIGRWAFGNCENLIAVSIPSSVTKIEYYALYNCANLAQILYAGTEEAWNAITKGSDWDLDTGAYQIVYSALCQNGHSWTDATCTAPKQCVNCGLTEGDALGHNFVDGNCTICGRANYSEGLEYKFDGKGYIVTGIGTCTDTNLVIPNTYEGLPVTAIGSNAFLKCTQLTSVLLPDSIVIIDDYAFRWCYNLASINIPEGVTTIGYQAISSCAALTTITIPSSVVTIEGPDVFFVCDNLQEIIVAEENKNYCSVDGVLYAKDMESLLRYPSAKQDTYFEIPTGVSEIVGNAFHDAQFTEVLIANGVQRVSDLAFQNCVNLTTVTIPLSVQYLGTNAFSGCGNLTTIRYAGAEELWYELAAELEVPSDYTVVFSCFCEKGHSWTDATCAEPKHCVNCGLTEGDALGHNYENGACTVCGRSAYSEGLEYMLDGDHYVVTGIGTCTDTELVIPATYNGLPVAVIGENAFVDCAHLTSIILPESIHTLGDYAFRYCTSLQSINIPTAVSELPMGVFWACDALMTLVIPANVSSIAYSAFQGCGSLSQIQVEKDNKYYCSVDGVLYTAKMDVLVCYPAGKQDAHFIVPSTVTVLEESAFYGAKNLLSIDLPEGLITISSLAFSDCYKLENVIIPSTVREIEDSAFQACSSLTSITIPANVQYIGIPVFYGCTALTEILVEKDNTCYYSISGVLFTADGKELIAYPANKADNVYSIPAGVEHIRRSAFGYAKNLQELVMPSGLMTIDNFAVAFCSNLSSITIPVSVTTIGVSAFRSAKKLVEIRYAGTEQMWNAISFGNNWNSGAGKYTVYYSVFCEKGHSWIDATCSAPKRCVNCGLTEGGTLDHTYNGDVCIVCGFWNIDGKTVKLQYVGNQRFVSPNPFNYGLSTTVRATAAVWTIRTQENGYVSLCCNGQYMTSTKGGELYLQEKLTEFSMWELIAQDDAYVLRNVGAGSYYLTLNGCFCTTWYNGTDWSGFLFNLVFIDGCEAYGHSWDSADCTQICTCVKCGMERGYGDHSFEKGTCVSCGVTISEGLDYAPMYDEYKNLIAYQVVGKGSCKDTVLVIPSEYKGVPVTSIGESAFMNHSELTKVIIPNGIREIGHSAFENCTSLTSVLIPKSVYSLGAKTFKNCTSLTTVVLECEPTTFWTPAPFSYCDKLTEVYIHSELLSAAEVHIVNYILGDTYAQRIYMLETLGSMHPTFVQAFTCTNGGEAVDVNGVGYIMYTKAAHNESVIDHQDATCTENGYTTYHCEDCDYQRMVTIYASGHDFDANYVCRNCSYAPNYLSFDGYEVADLILGEDGAYYTKDGNAVYIAVAAPISNLGGNSLQDYVEAYGDMFFSMTYWKILLRNTNEDGYAQLTKDSIVWILDLITGNPSWGEDESYLPVYLAIQIDRSHKHEYIAVVTAPTCTTDGYTTYTCSCGDTYVDDVIPAGHDWNISMSKVPTKETTGAITSTCNACGESASVELPKINSQDYYYEVVMAASATADGYGCYTWYTTDYGTVRFYEVIRHSVTGDAAQIEIESTTAVVGNTIRLEMVLKNNPGLMGLILRLDYDTSVLTLVDVQRGDLPMDMDASVEYNRLLWSANDQITENGVLCVLEFRIADGAQPGDYPITMNLMQAADADYKTVELHTVSGVIKVINVVYGDVNSDGVVDLIDVLMLRKYLVNIDPETGVSTVEVSAGADVNGDGEIDLIDVLMLRKYLVNIDPVTGESSVVLGPQ